MKRCFISDSELLEKLCLSLYDVLRPLIIHIIHLETLSELCSILKNEMLEDHVQNNGVWRLFFPSKHRNWVACELGKLASSL